MIPRLVLLLLLACALAGCGRTPRARAEDRLRKVDVAALRQQAAVLYKNMHASAGPNYIVIKQNNWPPAFVAFGPTQVGAYLDGFTLGVEQSGGREEGIYVIPAQMEVVPRSSKRAHFEPITDGIYWYTFSP